MLLHNNLVTEYKLFVFRVRSRQRLIIVFLFIRSVTI